MIEGLRLTLSGKELQSLLESRIQQHEQQAERWRHEQTRDPQDASEDEPVLPLHMCEHEASRHHWRSLVLAFIRDHVESEETYRLNATDLEFGELLPNKPSCLEQEEYEERGRVSSRAPDKRRVPAGDLSNRIGLQPPVTGRRR